MTFKAGDLVKLKSGGPIMTVDTVNTSIFDDNKITGVSCVWFVGDKLTRVRFDHMAIEPAISQETAPRKKKQARLGEATGDYKTVLDEMVAAMNVPAAIEKDAPKAESRVHPPGPRRHKAARRPVRASDDLASDRTMAGRQPA